MFLRVMLDRDIFFADICIFTEPEDWPSSYMARLAASNFKLTVSCEKKTISQQYPTKLNHSFRFEWQESCNLTIWNICSITFLSVWFINSGTMRLFDSQKCNGRWLNPNLGTLNVFLRNYVANKTLRNVLDLSCLKVNPYAWHFDLISVTDL